VDIEIDPETPVVLFDGVCNLCTGTVQWLIEHDDGQFRFASLQSAAGAAVLSEVGLDEGYFDSLVLVTEDGPYRKSDAALEIARRLGRPWSLAAAFRVLPRGLRDAVYDLVAATRYDIFGKRDQCIRPSAETRARFLDGSDEITVES